MVAILNNFTFEIYIFLFVFIIALLLINLYKYQSDKLNRPPGPKWTYPIFGHFFHLGKNPHLTFSEMSKKYGPVFMLQLGNQQVLILNSYDAIKEAFCSDHAATFAGRPDNFFFRLNGNRSITFANYSPEWRIKRKLVIRALSLYGSPRTQSYVDSLSQVSKQLIESMLSIEGKKYSPHDDILKAIAQVLMSMCFGKYFLKHNNEFLAIIKTLEGVMNASNIALIPSFFPWTELVLKLFIGRIKKYQNEFHHLCENLLKIDNSFLKASHDLKEDNFDNPMLTKTDSIHIIREVLAAGVATSWATLLWGIYYLLSCPEVQDKCFEEINRIISRNEYPTLKYKGKLPYTEATLLEIQRLSTIAPLLISHCTTSDCNFWGYQIPQNTIVIPNVWSVHYNEDIWPNPFTFDPSRFLTSDSSTIDQSKAELVIPFGLGRRRCAGENVGKQNLFILFTSMMQHCKFVKNPSSFYGYDKGLKGIGRFPPDYDVIVKSRQNVIDSS